MIVAVAISIAVAVAIAGLAIAIRLRHGGDGPGCQPYDWMMMGEYSSLSLSFSRCPFLGFFLVLSFSLIA